ncbi:hypothetical protein [Microbacterium sp. NPDC087665]|uniref:hypothetical protein n=1 Tax=Microbacterium sp. NPDC087665 TaxID=3364194 RepID=UPI00381F47E9
MTRLQMMAQLWGGERHRNSIAAERALRAPLPVIRRVGFASLRGGTGCTTAARAATSMLAGRRDRGVLFVDATGYRTSSTTPEPEDVTLPAPVWPGGVDTWRQCCDPHYRDREITVTDWGTLGVSELSAVAAHSHVLCLTTGVERLAVQHAVDIAAALTAAGTPTLIVASGLRGRVGAATKRMLASSPVPQVTLPYDRHVQPRPASVLAVAGLGAEIVRLCTAPRSIGSAA